MLDCSLLKPLFKAIQSVVPAGAMYASSALHGMDEIYWSGNFVGDVGLQGSRLDDSSWLGHCYTSIHDLYLYLPNSVRTRAARLQVLQGLAILKVNPN